LNDRPANGASTPPAARGEWPALEIVRFEVRPTRRRALLDGHLPARRAIHSVSPPGALWSRLTHIGGAWWVEVVAWERRTTFDRALELSQGEPVAREWFDLAEPGWTIDLARLESVPPAPPRHGHLEIAWDSPAVRESQAGRPWTVLGETDGRRLVDPSGWEEAARRSVRLTVTGGVGSRTDVRLLSDGGRSREGGQIIDSVDGHEEYVPTR